MCVNRIERPAVGKQLFNGLGENEKAKKVYTVLHINGRKHKKGKIDTSIYGTVYVGGLDSDRITVLCRKSNNLTTHLVHLPKVVLEYCKIH